MNSSNIWKLSLKSWIPFFFLFIQAAKKCGHFPFNWFSKRSIKSQRKRNLCHSSQKWSYRRFPMRSTTLHLPRRNYRVDFRRDYKRILWDARAFCNGARRGMDKTRVSTRDEVLSSSTQREARRESQRRRPLTTAMIVVHSSGDNAAGVVTLARASWFRESRWTIGPTHLSQYLVASWNLIHLSHLLSNHRSRWHSLVLWPK